MDLVGMHCSLERFVEELGPYLDNIAAWIRVGVPEKTFKNGCLVEPNPVAYMNKSVPFLPTATPLWKNCPNFLSLMILSIAPHRQTSSNPSGHCTFSSGHQNGCAQQRPGQLAANEPFFVACPLASMPSSVFLSAATFDFCLVDEASQRADAELIASLLIADRFTLCTAHKNPSTKFLAHGNSSLALLQIWNFFLFLLLLNHNLYNPQK
uniref:DNA2/NAM7 helicase helicase domain-containing protein n=1 Tax=Globodera rostochiensis TaxID=31243 RepID=A0A914I1J5_GLORO